eukprot:CAMPEP_0113520750 /NCGR_PEP_ID=MMETSP0014_2-20120614/44267_1 /TAXON_ID=2857 /ORGANISM="Nitzschia sp." /LENGTH=1107 /DNA_ID=CAMNT_0000418651 /DNA_START=216 /DNA_END=3539 /DNA_ORIENTATION=- /assembly_acc=CAM_ASM_000159
MYPSEAEAASSSSPHGPSPHGPSASSPSPSGSPEADGQQSLSTKPSSIEVSMMEVGPSKSMSEESIDVSIPQMPSNLEDDSVVGLQQVPSKSPGPSPSPRAGGGFHHLSQHQHQHRHHRQHHQQYGTKQLYNHRAPRPPSETSTVSMASFQTVQTLGSTATVSAATAFSNPIPEGGPLPPPPLPVPPPPAGSGDPTNASMHFHRPLPQLGRYPGGAGASGNSDMSISSGFTAGHGHGPTSGGHYYHDGYGVQPYHNHYHHPSHPHYDHDHHSSHPPPPPPGTGTGPIDGAGSDPRRSPRQKHGLGKEGTARSAEEEAGAMTGGDNHYSHQNPHHHQNQNHYHPHHHPQSSTTMGYGPSGYGPHHGHGGYGHGGGGHYAAGQDYYYPPRGGDGGVMGYHTGGSGMAPPVNHHHSQYHSSSAPYGGGPHRHHGPGGMGGMHSQSAYSTGGYHPHHPSHHYNNYGSHHSTPPGHHHQQHHRPHSQNGMTGWYPPHDRDPHYSRSRSSYGGDGGRSPETLGDSTIHTMESSSVQHHSTHHSVPGNTSQGGTHQSHSNSRNSKVPMSRSPSPTGIPAPPTTAISKPDGKGPKNTSSENRSPSAPPAANNETATAPTALGERKDNSALSSTSSTEHPKQQSSAGTTTLKTVGETKSPAKNKADATADAASILLALGGGKSDDGTAQQVAMSANTNTENRHPRTTNYGDEASISTSSSMPGLSSGPSSDSADNNSQRSYFTSSASSTGRISTSTMAETEFPCPVPEKYPRRLSLQCDASKLNSLHCFLRNELLEIFVVERSLAKTPIHSPSSSVGRVGLRCVHCAMARKLRGHSERDEAPMAVFYPKSIAEIYRLVTSWQRCHLRKCRNLPPSVRSIWQTLRENDKSRGKTHYWVTAAKQIGLLDCQSRAGGIRFAPNLSEFPAAITSSSCQPRELQQQKQQPEATIVAASAGAKQPQQDMTGPDNGKSTEMTSSKVTEEEPSMDQDAVHSKDTIMKTADESSPPENLRLENLVESTGKATQQAVVDDTPMEDVSGSNSAEKLEEDDKKKMMVGSETTAAGDADADADAGANMVLDHPVHDENNVHKQLSNDGKNSISAEKMSTAATTTTRTPV